MGAQRDLAGARVHGQVRKQQLAGVGVEAAVIQFQLHLGRLCGLGALQFPTGHVAAQAHDFAGRLGEVHVHRVDLLHQGQRRGFALTDQSPFGDQGAANAARNGRAHGGVVHIQLSRFNVGLGHGHIGLGLFEGRDGAHIFLLADGVGFDQGLVAFRLRLGLGQIGLCFGQVGLGAAEQGFVRRSVDLKQRLIRFHIAAFSELIFQQNAGHPRPDLGDTKGFGAARQLAGQAHLGKSGGHHADLGGWRGACATARSGRCWRLTRRAGAQQAAQETDTGPFGKQRPSRRGDEAVGGVRDRVSGQHAEAFNQEFGLKFSVGRAWPWRSSG